jgi:DNA-binding NtrC family response regulator
MALVDTIIGKSNQVQKLRKVVSQLAGSAKNVVIVGEAGVGKTSTALIIGGSGSSVLLDASRMSEVDLVNGLCSVASGTVILEGVEDCGYRTQDEVVRVLAGGSRKIRVITTLSKPIEELVGSRKLQQSLGMILGGFEAVTIPPLRSRPEDIPHLIKHFASGLVVDINTIDTLVKLPWQQNIRQLKALIDTCVTSSSEGRFVLPEEMIDERTEVAKMVGELMENAKPQLDKSLDAIEGTIIRRVMDRFGQDEAQAARFLGMTQTVLGQKLKLIAVSRITS